MDDWASTRHLILDREGVAWRRDEAGDLLRVGPVGRADVGEDLAAELAALADLWADGFDERAEQLWAYRRSVLD